MNLDKVSYRLYQTIFKNIEIENNEYKLKFLNCEKIFYDFAEKYYNLIGKNINNEMLELCIIFDFLYLNQSMFLSIFNNSNNESLDLLTFLNININITKMVNEKLILLDCSNYVIDIMNSLKYTELIHNVVFDINIIKKTLLDIFFKIISR